MRKEVLLFEVDDVLLKSQIQIPHRGSGPSISLEDWEMRQHRGELNVKDYKTEMFSSPSTVYDSLRTSEVNEATATRIKDMIEMGMTAKFVIGRGTESVVQQVLYEKFQVELMGHVIDLIAGDPIKNRQKVIEKEEGEYDTVFYLDYNRERFDSLRRLSNIRGVL